jgi:hypothetical protein
MGGLAVARRAVGPGPASLAAERGAAEAAATLPDTPARVATPSDRLAVLRRQSEAVGSPAAPVGPEGGLLTPTVAEIVSGDRGRGQPVPADVRRTLEPVMGIDLGQVRVHSGPRAQRASADISARAFTLGSDIWFGQGIPDVSTAAGQHLWAHELTHTVQQGTSVQASLQVGAATDPAEHHADLVADHVVAALAAGRTGGVPGLDAGAALGPGGPQVARVIRRDVKVTLSKDAPPVVGTVNYSDHARPGGNISGHAGDHTTAYVSYKAMVRNAIYGKTLPDARDALIELTDQIMSLPGASRKVRSTEYLFDLYDAIQEDITEVHNKTTLETVIENILSLRNQLGFSAYKNYTSTGGHGEAGSNAVLQECNNRLRVGSPRCRYDAETIVTELWNLFDFTPTPSVSVEEVSAVIAQHIFSMQITYPDLFAAKETSDEKHIPGLDCEDRSEWFLDAMYAYLAGGHTGTFAKYDGDEVKTVLAKVKKAVDGGPAALDILGTSQRYLEHMGISMDTSDDEDSK